ncbi:MAG: hypothetical protein FWC23_10040 [Chitinispirillia bacterium]|nr:hypothetical protein [Chitinispirillia bacterium]MCL2269508.1 hypothetical protein [Chitinispirillia bacterium]
MNKNYVPDSKLEWYLLNALPDEEQAEIAALEQTDAELRARIEALRASDAEILAEYPPSRMAERLKQRYAAGRGGARPRKRAGSPKWPLSIYICAALLLALPVLVIMIPEFIDSMEHGLHEVDGTHEEGGTAVDTAEVGGAGGVGAEIDTIGVDDAVADGGDDAVPENMQSVPGAN